MSKRNIILIAVLAVAVVGVVVVFTGGLGGSFKGSIISSKSETQKVCSQCRQCQLIYGDPKDTCKLPTYKCDVDIKGWYVFKEVYGGNKDWRFRVSEDDLAKLPISSVLSGVFYNNFIKDPLFRIIDANTALEKHLKNASKDNPLKLNAKGVQFYCEGDPRISVISVNNLYD